MIEYLKNKLRMEKPVKLVVSKIGRFEYEDRKKIYVLNSNTDLTLEGALKVIEGAIGESFNPESWREDNGTYFTLKEINPKKFVYELLTLAKD